MFLTHILLPYFHLVSPLIHPSQLIFKPVFLKIKRSDFCQDTCNYVIRFMPHLFESFTYVVYFTRICLENLLFTFLLITVHGAKIIT